MSNVRIQARSGHSDGDFNTLFAEASASLRPEPYRAGLIPREALLAMITQKLPRASELWLAFDGAGAAVGRVGANPSPVYEGLGYVGFFDVDPSTPGASGIASLLLERATTWLKSQGCSRVVGPVDLSSWFNYRFSVNKKASVPGPRRFSWEPLNPPEYPRWFENFGMKELHGYHSQGYSSAGPGKFPAGSESLIAAYQAGLKHGYRFRPLDLARLHERELPLLHGLSQKAFADAFLFEPIPLPVFSALYGSALKCFDFSPSCVLESPDGSPVGFNFTFIDGETAVYKTVVLLPEYRKLHLSSAMIGFSLQQAVQRGIWHFVSALLKSGAESEHHERRHDEAGARGWRHDYAVFGMELR